MRIITARVALTTYDALTDNDPRHYSLFADEDNILIKEVARGQATVNNNTNIVVTHNLGYFPHFYSYGEVSTGRFRVSNGYNIFSGSWNSWVSKTQFFLRNRTGSSHTGKYFIFYDNINP